MYEPTCSSSVPSRQPFDSDEISVFLHHLLHSSSSSSTSSSKSPFPPLPLPPPPPPPPPPHHRFFSSGDHHNRPGRILETGTGTSCATESSSGLMYFPTETPVSVGAVDCDAVAVSVKRRKFQSENDVDEFDCESEEGFETSDGPSKQAPSRSSSKRSRAAEVHNLSEKRRRSRINEKMKALQNLIPNSNKTDKASMLDEAIEYLKQLQLQVQMLSMRNGFSLHPMYLPGVVQPLQLPQMRMGFNDGNGLQPPHVNIGRDTLSVNPESSTRTSFGLSNQCTTSNQNQPMIIPNMINIPTSDTSYGLDSSIQANQETFQLPPAEDMGTNHRTCFQRM